MSTINEIDPSLDVLEIYPKKDEQKKKLFIVPHGKYTNSIASNAIVKFEYDVAREIDWIKSDGLMLYREHKAIGANEIGIGPHKLLNKIMSEFLKNNVVGQGAKKKINSLKIEFPLMDYLLACRPANKVGTEVTKQEVDNFRKKIQLYLNRLYDLHIEDGERNFGLRILPQKGIRNGMIRVEFSESFADLVAHYPLATFPESLYQIDEKHAVAYQIAVKLLEHTGNDNNVVNRTAGTLSVKSILKSSGLPDIFEVRERDASWQRRIKEPVLQALNYLITSEILEDKEFRKEKGEKITDEELNAGYLDSYEKFANSTLFFTAVTKKYHTIRVADRLRSTPPEKLTKKEKEFLKQADLLTKEEEKSEKEFSKLVDLFTEIEEEKEEK